MILSDLEQAALLFAYGAGVFWGQKIEFFAGRHLVVFESLASKKLIRTKDKSPTEQSQYCLTDDGRNEAARIHRDASSAELQRLGYLLAPAQNVGAPLPIGSIFMSKSPVDVEYIEFTNGFKISCQSLSASIYTQKWVSRDNKDYWIIRVEGCQYLQAFKQENVKITFTHNGHRHQDKLAVVSSVGISKAGASGNYVEVALPLVSPLN